MNGLNLFILKIAVVAVEEHHFWKLMKYKTNKIIFFYVFK